MRINLNVKYEDKDHAKALGARWDAKKKTWYVSNPNNLEDFAKWLPEEERKFLQSQLPNKKKPNTITTTKLKMRRDLYVKHCDCTLEMHEQEMKDTRPLTALRCKEHKAWLKWLGDDEVYELAKIGIKCFNKDGHEVNDYVDILY